jgi:hypothetical protein
VRIIFENGAASGFGEYDMGNAVISWKPEQGAVYAEFNIDGTECRELMRTVESMEAEQQEWSERGLLRLARRMWAEAGALAKSTADGKNTADMMFRFELDSDNLIGLIHGPQQLGSKLFGWGEELGRLEFRFGKGQKWKVARTLDALVQMREDIYDMHHHLAITSLDSYSNAACSSFLDVGGQIWAECDGSSLDVPTGVKKNKVGLIL